MTALRSRTLVPVLVAAALSAVGLRRVLRLEVQGDSMTPALRPGDRVLVVRTGRLRPGQVAAVRDPRDRARVVVKRVAGGSAAVGWRVLGDNPARSTDSRVFGPVPADLVVGRVVYRYHPPERAGVPRPGR
ncbi:MAG TPA: nickel-type superoxide dismutase maturation protease [Acidimicrobiales bacterium]|nr:nickel-type superoxide dismutase maturation protease [Acidimicrobiales bacterium]